MHNSINNKMWRAMDHLLYVLQNQRQHIRYVLYLSRIIEISQLTWRTTYRIPQPSFNNLPTFLSTYLLIFTYLSTYLLIFTYDRTKQLYYWVRHWVEREWRTIKNSLSRFHAMYEDDKISVVEEWLSSPGITMLTVTYYHYFDHYHHDYYHHHHNDHCYKLYNHHDHCYHHHQQQQITIHIFIINCLISLFYCNGESTVITYIQYYEC
jgi:hypothetical protein